MYDSNHLVWYSEAPVVSQDVVNLIDKFSQRSDLPFKPALVRNGVQSPDVRDVEEVVITDVDADRLIFNIVSGCVSNYLSMFPMFNITNDCGYRLLRYSTDGHYIEHHDASSTNNRVLTFLYYVNDDYTDGSFSILDQEYHPCAGSVIMFPSTAYYTHKVNPVTQGERRVIVTWLEQNQQEANG